MIAKAGLGLIGLSAISVGGVALAKPHLLGMDYMPEWHSLSEDSNFSTEHSDTTKFGKKYGRYLVGVTNKSEGNNKSEKTNEDWWKWAYRRLSRATTKPKKFENVTNGYGNDNTFLNQVCNAAYKSTDASDFGTDSNADQFTKADVWKYCSPGLLTHTNKDEDKYDAKTIGGETDNTSKLVSVKDSSNDWFWEQRNKDFWENSGDWSGSKATSNTDKSIFKTEYEKNNQTSNKTNRQTIKKLCGDAYKLDKNSKTTDNTDALKFCKLETN